MPSIAHSRQLRCCALAAVSLAALALGCTDQVAGPAATAPARAPTASAFEPGDPADSPDALSLTIGVDSKTGAGGSGDATFYPVWTVVDVAASGIVELTWEPASGFSGHAGQLDPGGRRLGYYNDICSGYGDVYAILANANGSYVAWDACSSLADNFHTRMMVKDYLVIGRSVDATVQLYNPPQHACGYAWLGWPGDCVSYSGSQSVSVTRLNADLTLVADSTSVGEGSLVTFTTGTSPDRFDSGWGVPLQMIRWRWVPDEPPADGAPRTQPCGAEPVCVTEVFESGTMSAEAFVNGKKLSRSVHVEASTRVVRVTPSSSALLFPSLKKLEKSDPPCTVEEAPSRRSMRVGVYRTSGAVVPNQDVRLVVEAEAGTGGHVNHSGERPVGGLVLTSQVGSTAAEKEIRINTGATGVVTVSYEASEFGGVHVVTGTATNARPGEARITVGVPLEALPPSSYWEQYGHGRETHPDVWYGEPAMNAKLMRLAQIYAQAFQVPIGYNDYSLQYGGRFETGGTWEGIDHCDHRFGRGIDVHSLGRRDPIPEQQNKFIHDQWIFITGSKKSVVPENDHYHLKNK